MKTYILLVTLLIIVFCHWSTASNTIELRKTTTMRQLISRRLSDLWTWIRNKGESQDGFVGRCFGIARKLKFIMPLIIFKLGVIITTLAFLTIFALKSLGLLVVLLVMNSSGWAAKLAHWKHEDTKHSAHNVHFHVHPKDYEAGHAGSSYEHGWYDKHDLANSIDESLAERLKKLNIYDSYRKF